MAEYQHPDVNITRPGYRFDPAPVTLDLYRLLCIVLADQRFVKTSEKSRFLTELHDEHTYSEIIRILLSSSVALRVWFDHQDPKAHSDLKTNCGRLFPNWPKKKEKPEVLTLREACNKIIHATTVNFDIVGRPHLEEHYSRPYLYLYGKKGKQNWRAIVSIVDFVKWSFGGGVTASVVALPCQVP